MAQDTIVKTDTARAALLTKLNGDIAELFTDVAGKAAAAHTHGGAGTVSFTIGTNASRLLATPTADLIWYADDTGLWWFYDFSITTWSQLIASATVPGVVELATDAEVVTGTDTARAVTPAGLQSKVASATAKGIVELATDAETVTGTDTGRVCTPANLTAKMAAPGAIGGTIPSTGLFTSLSVGATGQEALFGDTTAGRVLRKCNLYIKDGTNAATLKCQVINVWNASAIGETDNVAKDATTGNFTLDGDGFYFKIEAAGFTGNCIAVLSATVYWNFCGTNLTVWHAADTNDIKIAVLDSTAGTGLDLTTLVDTGDIYISILYLTDA